MAKLKFNIDNIESLYRSAREAYCKEFEDFTIQQRKHKAKMSKLNPEGRKEEELNFIEARKKHEEKLDAIRTEFQNQAKNERDTVEKVFASFYGGTIDNDIITMLDHDVFSESEILKMADEFLNARNIFMYRIIGKHAEKSKSKELQQLANNAKRISRRSDLDIIDNFVFVCNKGLRSEKHLADGIHLQLHEDSYDRSINESEGIEV